MEKPFTLLEKVTFPPFSSYNLPFTVYARWSRFISLGETSIVPIISHEHHRIARDIFEKLFSAYIMSFLFFQNFFHIRVIISQKNLLFVNYYNYIVVPFIFPKNDIIFIFMVFFTEKMI